MFVIVDRTQKRDLVLVASLLAILFCANFQIYRYFKYEIGSNQFFLPDAQRTPGFENKLYAFAAIHKNISGELVCMEIRNSENQICEIKFLDFWRMEGKKYVYYANFTRWDYPDAYKTYRFYIEDWSWYSDPVKYNPPGYFTWA